LNIPKKLTLLNCPPFLPNTMLEDMLINVGQIASQIKPIPLGIKNPALRHVKSFRRFNFDEIISRPGPGNKKPS
jgi:hypothetical protein